MSCPATLTKTQRPGSSASVARDGDGQAPSKNGRRPFHCEIRARERGFDRFDQAAIIKLIQRGESQLLNTQGRDRRGAPTERHLLNLHGMEVEVIWGPVTQHVVTTSAVRKPVRTNLGELLRKAHA